MAIQHVVDSLNKKIVILNEVDQDEESSKCEDRFPVDVLPIGIATTIREIHDKIGADLNICAQSVLAVINLATQCISKVEQISGSFSHTNEFFLTVAETGYRKSSSDSQLRDGIERFQKVLKEEYDIEIEKYKNALDIWKCRKKEILKSAAEQPEDTKVALEKLGPQPIPPLYPHIVLSDPTLDGILKNSGMFPHFLGILNDEGGQIIGGYNYLKENKARSSATLSKFWDGATQDRIRTDEVSQAIKKFLTIHLMVQPQIANILYSDMMVTGQGILSRCIVARASAPLKETLRFEDKYVKVFNEKIFDILMRFKDAWKSRKYAVSRNMALSIESRTLLESFSKYVHDINFRDAKHLNSYVNKMVDHAVRIGASIALFSDTETNVLEAKYMMMAIKICEFYIQQTQIIYNEIAGDNHNGRAEELLKWLKAKSVNGLIYSSKILKNGPPYVRKRVALAQYMKLLEKHDLISVEQCTVIDGQLRSKVWRVTNE